MAIKKKEEEAAIAPVKLELRTIEIPIEGITSLIMHRFDSKTQKEIEENGKVETGLKAGGKKKKIANPEEDYEASKYYLSDGKSYGFPALAFKAAMVNTAGRIHKMTMTVTKAAFQVLADDPETGLVKINGEPRMRSDMVRVGPMKVASPRYRAEFPKWSAKIKIAYIPGVLTEEQIVGLLHNSGFANGIGEWRPDKGGDRGMYRTVLD